MRAQHSVVGQKCASAIGGNGKEEAGGTAEEWGIGQFMGTASVARDLLEVTQKLGQTQVNYWGFVSIILDHDQCFALTVRPLPELRNNTGTILRCYVPR